ncbi:MAG: L-histidine N(alpha)-methyltransferase [Gammaproteobacteria bacterium]|nr:L-histidine N(alpha)-methyltransferase [Gammaproteobacteria bacterium]MDH5800374.1 L-histidine N(alpha)-methyltransferase [Gammaproteobacteria bacterium]
MHTPILQDIVFHDLHPPAVNIRQEVLQGLSNPEQRRISPKYLYDEKGSHLFDAICKTNDYYPTRTEHSIIKDNMEKITGCIDTGCVLVEPGSGNSQKVRQLLDAIQPRAYLPVDISKSYLKQEARKLASEFPWLEVHAVCADFTEPVPLPAVDETGPKVAFFPGSSIGNFEPADAVEFLGNMADMVERGGGLLIGVDLKKESAILNAAYNDSEGLTAAFNLNLLSRLNKDLDADFDLDRFDHKAFYNEDLGRIEMHLVSTSDQQVQVAGETFEFLKDETIHTENSYKYHVEEFHALAKKAGFHNPKVWTDEQELFSVHYLEAE